MRERFGPLPPEADRLLDLSRLRVLGGALGIQHILVRGDEARVTFRTGASPRMARLTTALDNVQLAARVPWRTQARWSPVTGYRLLIEQSHIHRRV